MIKKNPQRGDREKETEGMDEEMKQNRFEINLKRTTKEKKKKQRINWCIS